MTKTTTIVVLGGLVALLPFLGIPGAWKTFILVAAGLSIAIAGFLLRREATQGVQHDTFVENGGPSNDGFPRA